MLYGWTPGIGDPTVWGWLTVANYAFSAFLLWQVVHLLRWQRAFWWFAFAVMLGLGINKQLDLQSLFTYAARYYAKQEHWYAYRREVQALFVAIIGLIATGLCLGLVVAVRQLGRNAQLTCAGLVLVGGFVVIRAASFHHIDVLLGLRFGGFAINNLLENSAILLVSLGANRELTRLREKT
jgi:hypothetical protein